MSVGQWVCTQTPNAGSRGNQRLAITSALVKKLIFISNVDPMSSGTPRTAKEGETKEPSGVAVTGHGFDLTCTPQLPELRQPEPQPRPEVPQSTPGHLPLIFSHLTPHAAPATPQSDYYRHYFHPPPRGSTNVPANSLIPNSPNTASTAAPIPRGTVPRPRPMSLPPQTFTPSHSGTSSDRPRQYVDQPQATAGARHAQRGPEPSKPRTTNRILGEYTLSKTLGAGSMGKVKLALHNRTGEKVCASFHSLSYRRTRHAATLFPSLHPSRHFLGIYPRIFLIVFRLRHYDSSERAYWRRAIVPRTTWMSQSSCSIRGLIHETSILISFFPLSPPFASSYFAKVVISSPV
jgi:hypothetical protein